MELIKFRKAKPVWLKGLATEMNILAGFKMNVGQSCVKPVLRITASSIYKVWLDGEFVGHGPARCGHGFFRVDEWPLRLKGKDAQVAIEVCGYNANSFAYLDQPSFIQAEIVDEQTVVEYSGSSFFKAYRLRERVQKIHRYSFQRPFSEAYKLSPSSNSWRVGKKSRRKSHPLDVCAKVNLVPRNIPYPLWQTREAQRMSATGSAKLMKSPYLRWPREWKKRYPGFKLFNPEGSTHFPAHIVESYDYKVKTRPDTRISPTTILALKKNLFSTVDFGTNLTGFVALTVECKEVVDLYLTFDELEMENGDVSTRRYGCANVIHYQLKPGKYCLESLEPYTFKFLKILSLQGSAKVTNIFLREYSNPDAHKAQFSSSDPSLNQLFISARETFAQNATDIFMDCPGRERAGWLCDSFFTARAELALCGHNQIERNFLENYELSTGYAHLPEGMLPMCYPADHTDGRFIPNWAMWFVIELKEYLERSGNKLLIDSMKKRVYGLIDYFKNFVNSDGLLESLESWVFLEWSEANNFTQDVSYASNMVYVGMLEAAASLYDDSDLQRQARKVKKTILGQSFDGAFFVDNAIRNEDGSLEVTSNRTETCQYYAFFFDIATPTAHPELWNKLQESFGPKRDHMKVYPEIYPSNAFIGFFLRLNILSRYGRPDLVLEQLYDDFVPMSETTGTLWEHKNTEASCNHGFASQVAHILIRDILGVDIDLMKKEVCWNIPDIKLDWVSAKVPVGNEWIEASWQRKGGEIITNITLPAQYTLKD